uniref:phytanoyl-CoA dioxygenase family protein n=1 Tax=uncultured Mucilaginibacter sp. TaxID=797541 RepID=UPI0025DEA7F3
IFDAMHPSLPSEGFISGSYSPDLDYKKKASDAIVGVLKKHYERLFISYQAFGAAFLFKMPSQNSELGIHQDWTIVDEEKFVALNCWIPLTDVNEFNGALSVIPGSHYPAYRTMRAPTAPFFFSGNEDALIPHAIPMNVKAGEAVILNQSVIHYSPPNRSNKIRKAITAGIKSAGAPMRFHYKLPNSDQLEVFDMPEDFLISFDDFYKDIFERPKMGTSIGVINYTNPTLSRTEAIELILTLKTKAGCDKRKDVLPAIEHKSFFKRLAEVFK